MLDALAPAVMIAQAIGRWGNFFNAEAYGSSEGVKDFLFRMSIADYETPYGIKYVHPTFLYESLWNIVGFIIANILYRKKKINGKIFCFYLFWYGLGRAFIELLRTDSCMILEGLIENDPLDIFGTAREDGLKAFVYLSLALVITGITLFVFLYKKHKREEAELVDFESAIAEVDELGEETTVTEASNENANNTEENLEAPSTSQTETEQEHVFSPVSEETDEEYDDGEEGNDGYED